MKTESHSGFCNPHDTERGIAQHRFCRKGSCPCPCHTDITGRYRPTDEVVEEFKEMIEAAKNGD